MCFCGNITEMYQNEQQRGMTQHGTTHPNTEYSLVIGQMVTVPLNTPSTDKHACQMI